MRFQLDMVVNVAFWREFWREFFWENVGEFLEERLHLRVSFIGFDQSFWRDLTEEDFIFISEGLFKLHGRDIGNGWGRCQGGVEVDLLGVPIDVGVPFLQPGLAKDHIMVR